MKKALTIAAVALAQFALVGIGVAPQLSARATGETYRFRVEPIDPIDPFRGAYAQLGYPDLRRQVDDPGLDVEQREMGRLEQGRPGTVYIVLEQQGDVWVSKEWTRQQPSVPPYLTCDDRSWQTRCGIESLFLPESKAIDMQNRLADGAIATVKIDSRGHAALIGVE